MKTTVKLISHTANPLETIYACWEASRHNQPIEPAAAYVNGGVFQSPDLKARVHKTFQQVLESSIPVSENVSFTFLLENVSLALHGQMVRHRVGHHFGDRIGVDIVPDLADSTWWAQSMRILPMSEFATDEAYEVPESIRESKMLIKVNRRCKGCGGAGYDGKRGGAFLCPEGCHNGKKEVGITPEEFYKEQMRWIQGAYTRLVNAGVPLEDARNLIPLGATSRMTWTINLAALQHVVGKRGCWILQLGVWEPVIRGMIEELATNIDPIFRTLIAPPCIKGGKYEGCKFKLDNARRIEGEDEIPPCRLFVSQEWSQASTMSEPGGLGTRWQVPLRLEGEVLPPRRLVPHGPKFPDGAAGAVRAMARSEAMAAAYGRLWGFDPDLGPGVAAGAAGSPSVAPGEAASKAGNQG